MKILTKQSQEFKITLEKDEFEEINKFLNKETKRLVYACPLYKNIANIILKQDGVGEIEIHNIFYIDGFEFNVVSTIYKYVGFGIYSLNLKD